MENMANRKREPGCFVSGRLDRLDRDGPALSFEMSVDRGTARRMVCTMDLPFEDNESVLWCKGWTESMVTC